MAIVRSQRIVTVLNHLLGISQSIVIAVFSNPCLGIQIHAREQEPVCHAVYTRINIFTRSLQVFLYILQLIFGELKDLLTRPLRRNILHTRIFIYIRYGSKHIAQGCIAISTDETCLCTIGGTLATQLVPKTARLQLFLRTLS